MFKKDRQILELIFQKSVLEDKIKGLQKQQEPRHHIEKILGRGIKWYDYSTLDQARKQVYFNDVQQITTNEAFNNELHHYIADLTKFAAIESDNMEQVHNTRTGIIVLETFRTRLENIQNPAEIEISKDDLLNPI